MRRYVVCVLCFCLCSALLGVVDSLKQALADAGSGERAQIALDLSRALMKSEPEQALEYAGLARQAATAKGNNYQIADAIRLQGNYHFIGKRYDQSLPLYQQAVPFALKARDTKLIGDIYNNIGQSYLKLGDHGQAERFMMIALEHRSTLPSHEDEIATVINLGQVYWQKSDYQMALAQYRMAESLLQKAQNPKLAAVNYNNKGNTLLKLGDVLGAIEAFVNALELKLSMGDEADTATAMVNIGNLFYRISQYDRAQSYYLQAREQYQQRNDLDGLSIVDGNLGSLYNAMSQPAKALRYHESARQYYEKQGLELKLAASLNNIGNVHQDMGQYDRALVYYEQSIKIKQEIGDSEGLATSYKNIGETHFLRGDLPQALDHTERSLRISQQLQDELLTCYNYLQMSKIYAHMKDYQKAYEYLSNYVELDHKLHDKKSLSAIADMMGRLDIRQQSKEISDLRDLGDQKDAQMRRLIRQRIMFLLTIIMGATLTFFLIYLYRQKGREARINKQLSAKLEQLNQELEERIQQEIAKYKEQQVLVNQKSKLESLGVLSAGIAHEINQPLSAISMGLENIQSKANQTKLDPDYIATKSTKILDDVQRIRKIIDHVRLFSRLQGNDDLEQVDINHTISECVNVFAPVFNKLDIIIKLSLHPKKIVVVGNRYKIEQVLLNLLGNAKDTTIDKRQSTEIKTRQTIEVRSELDRESVVISVIDEGMGIDPDKIDKIFDPFFTTKNPDMGTGLGLAISYGIVSEMNGTLRAHSVPGSGSTFEISLPTIGGADE